LVFVLYKILFRDIFLLSQKYLDFLLVISTVFLEIVSTICQEEFLMNVDKNNFKINHNKKQTLVMIILIGRTTNIDERVVLLCFILNPEKMSIETGNCSCCLSALWLVNFFRPMKMHLSHSPSILNYYTLKKIGFLLNPQKKFWRFLKASSDLPKLKKRVFKTTKPKKVLTVYPGEEPSPTKPFFKFRTVEKGLVGKYGTFRVAS